MKDIRFSAKRQKQELCLLCAGLAVAFALNVFAILFYHTEWKELWTQLLWVVCIGIGLYALSVVLRGVICGVRRLFKKKTG
ncbi:MAG: hypothetical protein LBT78_06090 [Tannerella sp.]|jgi:Na+-driven multidrug efflux pump|nr:hypothetical protein [Tannerella sp.]